MTNELKPCPFCGGEAMSYDYEAGNFYPNYIVECCSCSARIKPVNADSYDAEKKAANEWNTRQPTFDWKPIEELTEEILTTKEKIPFIMMYQAKEPDFYHRYGAAGIFTLAKNDNDEFLICSNSSNWVVPLSKISETIYTHYKIITPPQTNQS